MIQLQNLPKKGCRDGYGEALVELGKKDNRIVALCGDLEGSTRAKMFQKAFPDRFFTVGIAEQNLMNVAAGLSLVGFIPNASSFGVFTLRGAEQIRNTISVSNLNVKIAGSHCGLNVGSDGPTQMGLEELAFYRSLPNFTVIWPCDYNQTKLATLAMNALQGPCYIQFGREDTPVFTDPNDKFEIGKAQVLREGKDITIIAVGPMVYESLLAAEELAKQNISAEVINVHTIKPIDVKAIVKSAKKTGAVVTAEDHQIFGGLGSAVAEVLSTQCPTKMGMVAINDAYGESGTAEQLLKKHGITKEEILKKALKLVGS